MVGTCNKLFKETRQSSSKNGFIGVLNEETIAITDVNNIGPIIFACMQTEIGKE